MTPKKWRYMKCLTDFKIKTKFRVIRLSDLTKIKAEINEIEKNKYQQN